MSETTLPRDAAEALKLWDSGEEIAAFEVETERCTQQEIYSVAFAMIRGARTVAGKPVINYVPTAVAQVAAKISRREIDVAHSIAYVALLKGWAAMVAQHLAGGHIKAIAIKKS